MIRSTARSLALLLLIVATLAAVSVPAHADRALLTDETSDVWSFVSPGHFTNEGSVKNADLERTWVRHQKRYVVVKALYVDLKKKASTSFDFHAYLDTRQRLYAVTVQVDGRGRWSGVHLVRYATLTEVDCDGLTHRVRFRVDTVRVRIPRACLDNPRWIRFQGRAASSKNDAGFVDDAIVPRPKGHLATRKPWTRRLYRG